ncbi:MlaD family protein [Patulibacter minatonensis]|uniref:MlaD family protein n=1 Tax=Patulibacter minatonensis TaxID=298163 RepID=UPI00047A593E|nr:MlaD family protein [Patulibacter minatonensis]
MNRRRTSLAGSPVLIGAATALIALVAVVLSYNANKGLPFITTYDINAQVADAKKLTTSVDVRIGGKRVGQVSEITPKRAKEGNRYRYYSELKLKLDKTIADLPVDTKLRVRPKSIIGAKFVELYPGTSKQTIKAGGTIKEAATSASVDLDEVTGLFDANLRRSYRTVIKEAANGFAGRGASLNEGLDALPATLSSGSTFLRTLSATQTQLGRFVRGLDSAMAALQPTAPDLGRLFVAAVPTLKALGEEGDKVGETIQLTPSVEAATQSASRVAAPVLRDAAELAKELRPGVRQLPETVDALHQVAVKGIPVLKRAPVLGTQLQSTLRTVNGTLQRPSFADSMTLLTPTLQNLLPALQSFVPQQVKCNYVGLFARNATSAGGSGDENGNWLRIGLVLNTNQTLRTTTADPNLHYQVYPDNDPGGCAVGNETYRPGVQTIGRVPGQTSAGNQATSAPAGTPKGPR